MVDGSPAMNSTRHVVHRALPPQACNWSILTSSSRARTSRFPGGTSNVPIPSTVNFGIAVSIGFCLSIVRVGATNPLDGTNHQGIRYRYEGSDSLCPVPGHRRGGAGRRLASVAGLRVRAGTTIRRCKLLLRQSRGYQRAMRLLSVAFSKAVIARADSVRVPHSPR